MKRTAKTLLFILVIAIAASQYAQAAEPSVVGRIIDEFTTRSQQWAAQLEGAVKDLFILCFTLELVMLGITALIKRESLEDIFGSLIMAALFGSFILACIMNYKEWSQAIMAGLASYTGLLGYDSKDIVTNPLDKGFELFKHIMSQLSVFSLADSLAFILAGFAILISFALITVQIIYIKCEAFVAVGAGFVLLGFGGCKFFKDYALNLMRYILSVGFKLYMLYAVLGLGFAFIRDSIQLGQTFTLQDLAVILVTALIILALTKSLPDVAAGLIQGAHVNTGGNMTSTIRTVANLTAAGAVASAVGTGKGLTKLGGGLLNLKDATQVARAGGASGVGKVAAGAIKAFREARSQVKLESPGASMARRVGSKLEAMKEAQLMNKATAPAQAAVSLPDVSASRAAKRQDQSANSSRSLVNYMQPRKGIGGALASLGAKNI